MDTLLKELQEDFPQLLKPLLHDRCGRAWGPEVGVVSCVAGWLAEVKVKASYTNTYLSWSSDLSSCGKWGLCVCSMTSVLNLNVTLGVRAGRAVLFCVGLRAGCGGSV